MIIIASLACLTGIIGFFVYRWRRRRQLRNLCNAQLLIPGCKAKTLIQTAEIHECHSKTVLFYTTVYKGSTVTLKKLNIKQKLKFLTTLSTELKALKELRHKNLNRFVTACIEPSYYCILTEYCASWSLKDILMDSSKEVKIATRYSFIQEVVSGMSYLHESAIKCHGRLKPSNIIITEQFEVKITDFGLAELYEMEETCSTELGNAFYLKQLWTAPELLRMNKVPCKGTQSGDVYSFAIILHEILYRRSTFYRHDKPTPREIITNLIRVPQCKDQWYRPIICKEISFDKMLIDLMCACWAEDPECRPKFSEVKHTVTQICGSNIDIHSKMFEHAAHNLNLDVECGLPKETERKGLLAKVSSIFVSKTVVVNVS